MSRSPPVILNFRRTFALLIVLVVVPSAGLSGFGVVAIINERAAVEKRLESAWRGTLESLSAELPKALASARLEEEAGTLRLVMPDGRSVSEPDGTFQVQDGKVHTSDPQLTEALTAVLPEGSDAPAPVSRAAGALLCAASFVFQVQSAQPSPADSAQALLALRQDGRVPQAALEALTAELDAGAMGQDKTAPRVVVAETDAANGMTLQIRLMAEGLATVRAQTRAEVERALGAGAQAAILADPLPDGDLHVILRALRKNAATEDLPVYVIVNKEDPAVVTASLEAGADDVLIRPANVEVLIAKLRRAIQQRQAARRHVRAAH
ncbi:two-component system response regulator [Pyxidicoccus sp. 3LG]